MSDTLRTAIISSAHRRDSQSARIAEVLKQHFLNGNADIIDLFEDSLPLWDGETPANDAVNKVQQTAANADAFIFVVPEWHGMAPAGLKNLLLWNAGQPHMAHKPVLLVGVSAAVGGAFVIAELRASGYKNARLMYTPEHLILRGVGDLWEDGVEAESDAYISKRAQFAVDQLLTYAEALKPVRGKLLEAQADYANGMS